MCAGVCSEATPLRYSLKDVLKISCKFTGEHPCQSVISVKFLFNFIEVTLWYGCFPVNLLHIFRTPFYSSTSGGLILSLFNEFSSLDLATLSKKRLQQDAFLGIAQNVQIIFLTKHLDSANIPLQIRKKLIKRVYQSITNENISTVKIIDGNLH